jgi:hypothetical protein
MSFEMGCRVAFGGDPLPASPPPNATYELKS